MTINYECSNNLVVNSGASSEKCITNAIKCKVILLPTLKINFMKQIKEQGGQWLQEVSLSCSDPVLYLLTGRYFKSNEKPNINDLIRW